MRNRNTSRLSFEIHKHKWAELSVDKLENTIAQIREVCLELLFESSDLSQSQSLRHLSYS